MYTGDENRMGRACARLRRHEDGVRGGEERSMGSARALPLPLSVRRGLGVWPCWLVTADSEQHEPKQGTYDIEPLPADSWRPSDVPDVDAVMVASVAREKAGRGAVAAALGVFATNGDLGLRLFVRVGEGGVVVAVADDGLVVVVVVAVVDDGNGAKEFEPPL